MVAPVQHTCQPPEVVLRAGGGTHTIMTHTKSLLAQRSCIAACELSRATAVMLGQFDNGHDILSHRHEWLEYAQPPARRWPDNAGAGRRRDNSDVTGHPCSADTRHACVGCFALLTWHHCTRETAGTARTVASRRWATSRFLEPGCEEKRPPPRPPGGSLQRGPTCRLRCSLVLRY
jgi:hypothetical protein